MKRFLIHILTVVMLVLPASAFGQRSTTSDYNFKKVSGSEKLLLQMLNEDEGDVSVMVSLARIYMRQEKYDEAIKFLNRAESFNSSYSEIYKYRMLLMDELGRVDECVDAALKYYDMQEDASVEYVAEYANDHYTYAVARIKAEINSHKDSELKWMLLLTSLYEINREYDKALELYDRMVADYGDDITVFFYRGYCNFYLGKTAMAIKDFTKAIEMNPSLPQLYDARGETYRIAGLLDKAIADYSVAIDLDPVNGNYYVSRGWTYELSENYEKALADFNTGIEVDKSLPTLYFFRGDLYDLLEKPDLARADYEVVLQRDTVVQNSCRHFALVGLDRDDEAVDWINKIIEEDPKDYGNWYDKACVLSLIGRSAEALEALETAFKLGFKSFAYLELDDDMDPIRDMPEYKALIEKYYVPMAEDVLSQLSADPDIDGPKLCEIQTVLQN